MNYYSSSSFRSGLAIVLFGFVGIVIVNLYTLEMVPPKVITNYIQGDAPWRIVLSISFFDSWGSIIGLLGVILLFIPILLGKRDSCRVLLSAFFVGGSIGLGIFAGAVWDVFLKGTGSYIAYGASAIAIVALSVIFSESCLQTARIFRASEGPFTSTSVAELIVYLTVILSSLWFVLFIPPIYIPSSQYNWQVHEIGFLLGIVSTLVFEFLTSIDQLRGNIRRLSLQFSN